MTIHEEIERLGIKNLAPKILIVDDEAPVADILSRQFKECGFQARNAYNLDGALFLVKEDHFDVILVDLVLPGVSGYSVINYLRDITHVPVFAMTGYPTEDTKRDVELLGAQDLLSKPFEIEDVLPKILSAISRIE